MQEDKFQRVHVITDLVDCALEKCQSITSDSVSKEFVTDLLELLSDASNKIANMRWTDANGLASGGEIYRQTIQKL